MRVGEGRWSAAAEKRFLAYLAECANVRRAAAAAGFSTTAVYRRRLSDPGFAARWAGAAAHARARTDLYLIEAMDRTFDPGAGGGDPGAGGADLDSPPRVTIAEAIQIVKLYGPDGTSALRAAEARRPRGAVPPAPPIEEVREEVLRRIAAIRRHREENGEDGGGGDGRG